jgi:hypothetical protein
MAWDRLLGLLSRVFLYLWPVIAEQKKQKQRLSYRQFN